MYLLSLKEFHIINDLLLLANAGNRCIMEHTYDRSTLWPHTIKTASCIPLKWYWLISSYFTFETKLGLVNYWANYAMAFHMTVWVQTFNTALV